MVFLGYVEGTKAYWLYDPREDKVLALLEMCSSMTIHS